MLTTILPRLCVAFRRHKVEQKACVKLCRATLTKVFTYKCVHFYETLAWNFKDKAIKDFQTA